MGRMMTRRHQRALATVLLTALVFGAYYLLFERSTDPLSVPFKAHESHMNSRAGSRKLVSRHSYDWRRAPFVNKVETYIPLPTGTPHTLPLIQAQSPSETRSQRKKREARKLAVRNEFQRAWQSYRQLAWARDELKPIRAQGLDTFGGWGATLVDSLDTLWMMGFKDEFYEAVEAVAAIDFGKSEMKSVSVFETTIRYLGGLLSAYDLSAEPMLLEKAVQLGEMLYRAFDTTNNTPLGFLDIERTKNTARTEFAPESNLCFACLGSLTMEFTRLAQITSQPRYYDVVAKVSLMIANAQDTTMIPGLWPTIVDAATESFNTSRFFSIGALADSSYEYLPKMHALLGGLDPVYEKMYKGSAAMIDKYMLFRPSIPSEDIGEDLLFCGDVHTPRPGDVTMDPDLQHLTCFIGGMFGLAGRMFQNPHHVDLGAKLTKGCAYAYLAMPSGIMPETFVMMPCYSRTVCPWNHTAWEEQVLRRCGNYIQGEGSVEEQCDVSPGFLDIRDKRYLLRPEAIESVFVMYRITGDEIYLDLAWDMFSNIVAASRTPYAHGQVLDVTLKTPPGGISWEPKTPGVVETENPAGKFATSDNVEDKMESFWTAETLKYFYLIFSNPDMISLDDWVFNTEAHPFRRPRAANVHA
jgi:mannosyl-oligosaccharide alpha-1,2-mannosidase